MIGKLLLNPTAGFALETGTGDDVNLGGDLHKGGTLFLHESAGVYGTAVGESALANAGATTYYNTAVGYHALYSDTDGMRNTAVGAQALADTTTGSGNTAVGWNALGKNIDGLESTGLGNAALANNTSGHRNTAVGRSALWFNSTGSENIALGGRAGYNLTTGSNNIHIGNLGLAGEANTIKIGTQGTQTKAYVAGIYGTALPGLPVVVTPDGQLGIGAAAGSDADTLDGLDSLQFLRSDADDEMTARLTLNPATGYALETGTDDDVNLGGILRMGGTPFLHDAGAAATAVGFNALTSGTVGWGSTAVGNAALELTYGNGNSALGHRTLPVTTSGS